MNGLSTRESSISVAVRVRPFTEGEENKLVRSENDGCFLGDGSLSNETPKRSIITPNGIRKIINVVDDKMLIFDPPETNPLTRMQNSAFANCALKPRLREYRFVFDQLFDVLTTQNEVYCSTTRPLLDSILDGYNATVFAYGATGCGKTHTILGTQTDPGVIFCTMKELYERIDLLRDTKTVEVSLSFLEIYNETIRDLLNPETDFKRLVLREDANNRISVANLLSHKPEGVDEVMELIMLGNQNRTSSPTEANATSSRSHAVLQVNVIQKSRTADINEEHTFATLSIIDLAGSERAAATRNRGARLNEGANINKSLLALGNCINALCDPRSRNHIPYRDSKLTRLLKFSLGGNCKTVMIVCISPLSQHYDETLNTLKYANRAKEIKTKLIRNQHNLDRHVGSYLKMITEQKQEIEDLRNREKSVVEARVNAQRGIQEKCLYATLHAISLLKESLDKQFHEKWTKYFLLAKRKLLLLRQVDNDLLSENIDIVAQRMSSLNLQNLLVNVDRFRKKIKEQIVHIEKQYERRTAIDDILDHSMAHTLKRLQEMEEWSVQNTLIFETLIEAAKDGLQRDILVNSSILFDHLVGELHAFHYLPKCIGDLFLACNSTESARDIAKVIDDLHSRLQSMINSDYDSAIDNAASLFMQQKIKEELRPSLRSSIPLRPVDVRKMLEMANKLPSRIAFKVRDAKRGSSSPLKSSPPRHFKKAISKKNGRGTLSPTRLFKSKKVRWDVPNNSDSTLSESEANDTFQKTANEEDQDESPLNDSILDKSDFMDSLNFLFDPTLDSPPVSKILQQNRDARFMSELKRGSNTGFESLTSRKLPTSDDDKFSILGPGLLNREASTKVSSLGSEQDPNSMPAVAALVNQHNYGMRNVDSAGSTQNVD